MGNLLTSYTEAKHYQTFEGILLGIVTWIAIVIFEIVSCFYIIRHFGNWEDVEPPLKSIKSYKDFGQIIAYIALVLIAIIVSAVLLVTGIAILIASVMLIILVMRNRDNTTNFTSLKKEIHGLLMTVFPTLITKKVRSPEETAVCLFGDKEFAIKDEKYKCTSIVCHCYTYFYFVSMIILASLWFIAMAIENGIYRKTTTCNDINVQDNSFTCFDVTKIDRQKPNDVKPALINCDLTKNTNIAVFCYLFQPNLAAFGIAFSISNLILFGVRVYFRIAIKMAEYSCGRYLLIAFHIIGTILALVGLAILPSFHFAPTINFDFYFFRGNAVIRWTFYILTIFTAILMIQVPWCGFTDEDSYRSTTTATKPPQDSEQA